jgi:hypothetical protein
MKRFILYTCLTFSITLTFFTHSIAQSEKKFTIEANVVWPFVPGVEIYNFRVPIAIQLSPSFKSDIVLGTVIRPKMTDDENAEEFSEYGLGLGYRHYIWKGFHIEPAVYFSYAMEKGNKMDGNDYSGLAITTELYAGYLFDIKQTNSYSLYSIFQTGIGGSPYQNLGPETEKGGVFPVISLLIGWSF